MNIINLKLTNFLSFKELDYTFKQGIPVLIQGVNLTDDSQESNGAGKSSFPIGLEYCYLHTNSKGTVDKDLIFWGKNESTLESSIFCPIRNETLKIERTISLKGGSKAQLSINDEIKYSFDDKMVNEIDKFIIEWIGITKEDIQNYFILSKFKYESFFSASNTKLVQLIGRFSNSSIISGIDQEILKNVAEEEVKRAEIIKQINSLEGSILAYKDSVQLENDTDLEQLKQDKIKGIESQIDSNNSSILLKRDSELEKLQEIKSMKDELKEISDKLKDANKALTDYTKGIPNYQFKYQEIDQKVVKEKESKSSIDADLLSSSKEKQEVELLLMDIEKNLKGSVKCPKCQFEFVVGQDDINIEEERETKKEVELLLPGIQSAIEVLRENIQAIDINIKNLNKDKSLIEIEERASLLSKRGLEKGVYDIETRVNQINNNITQKDLQITSIRDSIKAIEGNIVLLEKAKVDATNKVYEIDTNKIKLLQDEITKCQDDILDYNELDKQIEEQISYYKQWSLIFREFTQYISSKTLKILEGYANKFLNDIGSDLRVQLEGYKVKSDGSLSEKITAYVLRDGAIRTFASFSGGERVRLEAALIMCISNAINSTSKWGGINFLSIDEIFESTDRQGIVKLIDSFKVLNKTILLTTHIPNISVSDLQNSLTIVKENKISQILKS